MIRFFVTAATMLFLVSVYFLYGAFVVPFTVALDVPEQEQVTSKGEFHAPALSETAKKYFSDIDWIHSGGIKSYQSEEMFFYTKDVSRDEESGNKVLMSPIAILWQDPEHPEKQPMRLIAEQGLIQFENRFFDSALQLTNSKPGRIIWGTLDGVVHIDGPDGLAINGQHFVFSEQSGQLYSDYPVNFHYGPTPEDRTEVTGQADQLNISLTRSNRPVLGKDMPRIDGASLLTLRKNVVLDTVFFQKGKRHTAHLECDGPFEYDFIKKRATFNSRVKVEHLRPKGNRLYSEILESERLWLQFVSVPKKHNSVSDDELDHGFDELELKEVRALGSTGGLGGRTSRVFVKSEKQGIAATMQDLTYDLKKRHARFLDPKQVVAKQKDATFSSPHIEVIHTEDDKLETLRCHGPGHLRVQHEKLQGSYAEAIWYEGVEVIPEPGRPFHIAKLFGKARIVVPDLELKDRERPFQLDLTAEQLRVWIDLAEAEKIDESFQLGTDDLPVDRVDASGSVKLASNDVVIDHSNYINVLFDSDSSSNVEEQADDVIEVGFSESKRGNKTRELKEPVHFSVDQIEFKVSRNSETGKVHLRHADGTGDVTLTHYPEESKTTRDLGGNAPLIIRGKRVVVDSDSELDQRVTLMGIVNEYGTVKVPAELEFGPTRIKGANITFDRLANQVSILGAGAFQIPVRKDFNGKLLSKPANLEVVWQERMTFDGKDANFFDAVSCSLNGHQESTSRMTCDHLRVQLTERIDFASEPDRSLKPEIHAIHAKFGVELESNAYEGRQLSGARRGKLAEFHINQQTGQFVGLGPGEIHTWTLGDQVKLSPTDTAEANQPIEADEKPQWRYSRLEFSGKFTGNIHQKSSEFERQEIKILSAPVEQALVKFPEDHVSIVENAVRLDCQNLKVLQREFSGKSYWEIFAQNVNELEGQLFRAVADELSFDESLGRFILRGIGRDATLYFQERPGAPFSPSSHRYIEFIPKKRSITVDGSSGLSG